MWKFGFSLQVLWVAVAGHALAFGSDDRWQSGWGQGVAEAIVTRGAGNSIYVTCDDGAGRNATAISFNLRDRPPTGSRITLTFDSDDPEDVSIWDGEIKSDCRACASVYEYVIEKLRSKNSVHVRFENGDAARFTLKGSRKAIGQCTPDFARDDSPMNRNEDSGALDNARTFDGQYVPENSMAGLQCYSGNQITLGLSIRIEDGHINYPDDRCMLTNPSRVSDSVTRFIGVCAGEGNQFRIPIILAKTDDGVIVTREGEITRWKTCSSPSIPTTNVETHRSTIGASGLSQFQGLFYPQDDTGSWSCKRIDLGTYGGSLGVQKGVLYGTEWSCKLESPRPSPQGVEFVGDCTAEGDSYREIITLRRTTNKLVVTYGGDSSEWHKCPAIDGDMKNISGTKWSADSVNGANIATVRNQVGESVRFTCKPRSTSEFASIGLELKKRLSGLVSFKIDDRQFSFTADAGGVSIRSDCPLCVRRYKELMWAIISGKSLTVRSWGKPNSEFKLLGAHAALGGQACIRRN